MKVLHSVGALGVEHERPVRRGESEEMPGQGRPPFASGLRFRHSREVAGGQIQQVNLGVVTPVQVAGLAVRVVPCILHGHSVVIDCRGGLIPRVGSQVRQRLWFLCTGISAYPSTESF